MTEEEPFFAPRLHSDFALAGTGVLYCGPSRCSANVTEVKKAGWLKI